MISRSSLLSVLASFPVDLRQGVANDWAWLRPRLEAPALKATLATAAALCLAAAATPARTWASPEIAASTLAATTAAVGAPGSTEPGREGAENSAIAVATAVGLPLGYDDWRARLGAPNATDPAMCPPARLEVSWRTPRRGYEVGGHVEPLGPAPTADTRRVNGIVLCRGSAHAYLGFEAAYEVGRWWISPVPALANESSEPPLLEGEADRHGAVPASGLPAAGGAPGGPSLLPSLALWDGVAIEALAPHVAQLTCDPVAKSGVLGFRDLLLSAFPNTRNLGIGRACGAPGVSEHKEGRAFDWGVRADDPAERAAAETVITWLLATDQRGNPFAAARRTGLMYVIWDGRIWSAERAHEGWRPYVGVSDHTDHIHFSFSWAGARAETSFWGGELRSRLANNAPDLPLTTPTTLPPLPPLNLFEGLAPLGGPTDTAPTPPSVEAPANQQPSDQAQASATTPTTEPTTTTPPPTTTTTTTAPTQTWPTLLPPLFGGGTADDTSGGGLFGR